MHTTTPAIPGPRSRVSSRASSERRSAPARPPLEQLLEGLNPDQRSAVEHGEGPLLVLAGAGSGKTRVLVHRIAYLLATGMARPGQILAITFTNKAANEMKTRVADLTGAAARVMWVMTFHSACARILRQHAERLGYKRGFSIYDDADSVRMVKRCMDELDVDPKRYPARTIKSRISDAKNRLIDAETFREEQGSYFEAIVADVYAMYEKQMHDNNAMDFDDLLVRTVNLLELFTDVREGYARQFRHVLVDEYQDTNRVQYRLLQLLTEESGNLFVVGDDAQSIYGFRAAEIRNILDFEKDFDATRVKLEQNYRSTQTILDASNELISHNRDQLEKRLWTDAGQGEPRDDRRAPGRARGGALGRRRDRAARRGGGDPAHRGRGLLPDERPEPGARGHAGPLRRPLPGDRRHQVLRAGRDQGRGRLPDAARQPRRHRLPAARDQHAPPRHRQDLGGAPALVREHGRQDADRGPARAGRGAGPGLGRGQGDGPLRRARRLAAREGGEEGQRLRPARGGAERVRLHRRARRRAHDRGRGAGREPARAGRRRRRVRPQPRARGRRGARPARGVPRADLALHGAGRHRRRRGAGHADDPPQRQGPRVPRRLHHRLRGRRLPALPLDRRGRHRGGAPPRLRRPDPRPRDAGALLRPPPHDLRRRRLRRPLALPRRDPRPARRASLDRQRDDRLGQPRLGRRLPRRLLAGRSPRSRRWSWRSATTSSTPPSARASSPRSSRATSSSSASAAAARSAS